MAQSIVLYGSKTTHPSRMLKNIVSPYFLQFSPYFYRFSPYFPAFFTLLFLIYTLLFQASSALRRVSEGVSPKKSW